MRAKFNNAKNHRKKAKADVDVQHDTAPDMFSIPSNQETASTLIEKAGPVEKAAAPPTTVENTSSRRVKSRDRTNSRGRSNSRSPSPSSPAKISHSRPYSGKGKGKGKGKSNGNFIQYTYFFFHLFTYDFSALEIKRRPRTPEPTDSEPDDMFAENNPVSEEQYQKQTNEEYLEICFRYALKRQGITDEMLEQQR